MPFTPIEKNFYDLYQELPGWGRPSLRIQEIAIRRCLVGWQGRPLYLLFLSYSLEGRI